MARSRGDDEAPDRLTAVLEELDAVRRAPAWVPTQDAVLDEPRSRVADLPRRVAATRRLQRGEHTDRPARHATRGRSDEVHPREPLLRPPEPLIGARVAPSRLAVVGAVILVLLAGLIFGSRVLWARAAARPQAVGTAARPAPGGVAQRPAASASSRAGFGARSSAPASSSSVLIVQVVGQVHSPGVVRVAAGSRVQDAVSAAGGALLGADLAAINLARPVADGEQIDVPKPGETPSTAAAAPGAPAGTGGASGAGPSSPTVIVDLNTADAQTLDTLPGVGPVMAQRILQWRADNGNFTSVEELGEVSGIGDKMLARLRPLVRVG